RYFKSRANDCGSGRSGISGSKTSERGDSVPNTRQIVLGVTASATRSKLSRLPTPLTLGRALCYPYKALNSLGCAVTDPRMVQENKHLEVVLDTQVESVNLAEEMCLRVAEAAGFDEEMCYRIGMSVREGVINAFHYGNQEKPEKKIHLAMDITKEKLVIHVMDEGKGFKLSDVPDPLAE